MNSDMAPPRARPADIRVVCVDVASRLEMLDLVDVTTAQLARQAGLDDDSIHWVTLATREAVANAMKHGNAGDEGKRVHLEFEVHDTDAPPALVVRVRDEGRGFDPVVVADPLDPRYMSRPCGRGLLIMRSVVDEVIFEAAPDGGMAIIITKRAALVGGPAERVRT